MLRIRILEKLVTRMQRSFVLTKAKICAHSKRIVQMGYSPNRCVEKVLELRFGQQLVI